MADQVTALDNMTPERFSEIVGGVSATPGAEIEREQSPFMLGVAEANTDIRNLYNYTTSHFPNISLGLEYKDGGLQLLDSSDLYGKDFTNPLVSPQVRRNAINARRDAQIFRDYWSTSEDEGGVRRVLGNLVGYTMTPTSLVPIGKGLAKGAAVGAAIGAEEMALEGLARHGEVDPSMVALGIGAGGGIGGALGALTKRAGRDVTKTVTKENIVNQLSDEQILTGGIVDFAKKYTKPGMTLEKVKLHNKGKRKAQAKYLAKLKEKLKRAARKTRKAGEDSYIDGAPARKLALEASERDIQATSVIDRGLDDPKMTQRLNGDGMNRAPRSEASEAANGQGAGKETARESIEDGMFLWDSQTGEKLGVNLTKLSEQGFKHTDTWYEKMTQSYALGKWLTRPWKVLEKYGDGGKFASDLLREAEEMSYLKIGQGINNFGTNLVRHGLTTNEEFNLVTDVVRKVLKPSEVTPGVAAAAKDTTMMFESILKEAHKTGIISDRKFKRLVVKGKKDGYWPRVYDQGFINTSAGKNQWENALTDIHFRNDPPTTKKGARSGKEKAARAIESIIGSRKAEDIDKLLSQLEVGKTSIRIPKTLARTLWKERGRAVKDKRSNHLEYARSIPEEMEEALTPFLVRDPQAVMSQYLQDVYGRIEYARVFGANDEVAELVSKKLTEVNKDIGDMFNEVYWQAVRSTNSRNIQSFIEQPEITKRLIGSLKSFESLKLLFSPIVNAGQAIINGTTALQSISGVNPARSYFNALRGITAGLRASGGNPSLRRDVARSGASLQTVIMQNLGGLDEGFHTLFQRKLTGVFSPLEMFNNPSTFLKNIGFFKVEEFNRSVGYFMGRAQAESLIENKIRYLRMGDRVSPRKMAQIDKGLTELGLDPNVRWDLESGRATYSVDDMERAAQRFSNEVNFINTSVTLPTSWNSFYGKLTRQFQSFSFHQGVFIRDKILRPLKEGNPLPLMTYLGVGTPIGMSLAEFKRFLVADDEEHTGIENYLSIASHFGGAGITLDYMKQAYYSPLGLAGAIVGPGLTDLSEIASAATKTIASSIEEGEMNFDPLTKAAAKMMVYPYKKEIMKNWEEEKSILDSVLESSLDDVFEE